MPLQRGITAGERSRGNIRALSLVEKLGVCLFVRSSTGRACRSNCKGTHKRLRLAAFGSVSLLQGVNPLPSFSLNKL